MIVTTARAVPRGRRPLGGFGFVWLEAIASLIDGNKGGAAPGVIPSTVPLEQEGSDAGLYIALGVGALLVTGIAVTLLRSPTPKPVAGYRRRRRSKR